MSTHNMCLLLRIEYNSKGIIITFFNRLSAITKAACEFCLSLRLKFIRVGISL